MTKVTANAGSIDRSGSRQQLVRVVLVLIVAACVLSGCDALISPQHRVDRARADIAAGQWGRAAIELRKVVQADPKNAQAWLALAELSLDAGDATDAANALEHAQKAGAKELALDPLRARAWLATNQPKALINAVAHHDLNLPEPARTIMLARAYNELRKPDRALALLGPILAANPRSVDARLALAEALARKGQTDTALHELDATLATEPRSYSALLLKGQILERRGDFARAEQALAAAVRAMPPGAQLLDRVKALAGLTETRLALGRIEDASKSEVPLQKLLPDAPAVEVLSARIKLAHHDYVNGIADLERAVDRAPNYLQARMLLGAAQLARGDIEQARMELQQVLKQAPDNLEARKLLANLYLKLGQPAAALQILTPALAEHATDSQLFSILGQAEQRVGNSRAVVQALELAVQAHPGNRDLRLELASAYLGADRGKDALAILEQAPGAAGFPRATVDLQRETLLVTALNAVRGPSAAAAEVERLLAAHPHEPEVLDFAATYYASERQLDHARALVKEALVPNGRDVRSLLVLARIDAAAGNDGEVEAALRTALSAAPSSLPVRIALAEALAGRRKFGQAEQLLSAADGLHVNPALPMALARIELARGDLMQANAALDHAIALAPGRAEPVEQAGMLLLDAHQYDAALARFRKAAEMAPGVAEYWYNVGRAQLALNQPDAAKESLEKADQLEPQSAPVVGALALIDLREKNGESALGRANALLSARPEDPDALVLKGDIEAAIGQPQDAVRDYTDAQHRRPTASVAVKLFRARLAAHQPHPDAPLDQWLASEPQDAAVRTILGDYELAQRDFKRAAREYRTIVQSEPNDVVALNNLAWTYQQLDDPRAESVAERAYKLAPSASNVDDTLGWILARKHDTDRALSLLSQAVKANSSDPELQYHYAYALAQSGKRAEARKVLSKVLAGNREFDSRREAERLLADLRA